MRAIPPLLSLLLIACQGPSAERAPGEPLAGEEQALADAEAMIEEHSARLEAETDAAAAEQTQPATGIGRITTDD